MSSSLRLRVALLIVGLNVTIGGVALLFALRQAREDRGASARAFEQVALSVAGSLVDTVARQVDPDAGLNVARLLAWESWPAFADALVCDHRLSRDDGRLSPAGIAVNPLGRRGRESSTDEQAIYGALRRALDEERSIDGVEGGRAMPIFVRGRIWGACWFRLAPPPPATDLVSAYFVPAFLGSTLLVSLATFFALRRFVLDPVSRLAGAANRVASGDYSVRVPLGGAQDELASLVHSFNAMTDQVELFNTRLEEEVRRQTEQARLAEVAAMKSRRLAAMGELAAGIAHEINNPLGGLLNAVERLDRGDLEPEKRARYLELLANGLERIRRTVGQLLRLAPRRASNVPFALHEPVEDALALVRHRAQRQEVSLSLEVGPAGAATADPELARERLALLPTLQGEPNEIGQAVLNLLGNALDALEEPRAREERARAETRAGNGSIVVRLAREGDELVVEVRDDGPGVAEEDLPRLGDLFYTTKAPGKGTGLGLGIVHQIAARHGGRVELSSRPGAGFTVRLFLPTGEARARAGGDGRPGPGADGRPRTGGRT